MNSQSLLHATQYSERKINYLFLSECPIPFSCILALQGLPSCWTKAILAMPWGILLKIHNRLRTMEVQTQLWQILRKADYYGTFISCLCCPGANGDLNLTDFYSGYGAYANSKLAAVQAAKEFQRRFDRFDATSASFFLHWHLSTPC